MILYNQNYCSFKITDAINSPTPFEAVGIFLENLLINSEISNCVLPKRVKQDHKTLEVGGILHIAMEFTQSDIMKLLLSISECVPEYYDILYCGPHMTTQDLNLFIERCREFGRCSSSKWREFYFLEINKLLYEHQEVCSRTVALVLALILCKIHFSLIIFC